MWWGSGFKIRFGKKAADVLYHYKDEVSEFPRCNFSL